MDHQPTTTAPRFLPSRELARLALEASAAAAAAHPQTPLLPGDPQALAPLAAAGGSRPLRLWAGRRFPPPVSQELLDRLPINVHAATPILDQLHAELSAFARAPGLTANWGRLTGRPDGLVLELAPFHREP